MLAGAVVGVLILAGLGVGAWLAQRPLLYLAGGTVPADPPPGVSPVPLATADGLELDAWWVPAASPRAAAIVLPGNAGTRADREPLARLLTDLGVSVLLVDYRGFADNPGRPSEAGLRADARAARDWLDQRTSAPVIYIGESLGAAVAVGLATERPPAGLVLRSPFPSLAQAAAAAYGLPAVPELVLRDRYPVAEQIATLDDVAIVVLAGAQDEIVPPRLSAQVAAAAGVQPRVVERAGHNDPLWLDSPAVRQAVEDVLPTAPGRVTARPGPHPGP